MQDYKPTYWNEKGRYQFLYDELESFIPGMGSVLDVENERRIRMKLPSDSPKLGRKGKFYHLEALRLGVNQYYDLYNNGLYNRYHGFKKRFGVSTFAAKAGVVDARKKIDMVMDQLIINAAVEIGLVADESEAKVQAAIRIAETPREHESRPVVTVSSNEEQVPLATVS